MQQYFIHKDNEQQGPFSLEELKELGITKTTMVWYEGLENWVTAGELEELSGIIKSIPPPIFTQEPEVEPKTQEVPVKKSSRTPFVIGLVAVAIICFVVYIIQSNKQAEIERHLSRQREIFLEQSEKMEQQQKMEEVRYQEEMRREEQEAHEHRQRQLENLKAQYEMAVASLRNAEYELEEVQKFVFLRTASEKREQVNQQMEVVRSWELEVAKIKRALDQY